MSHDHKGHPGHTKSLKALRNLIKLPGDRDLVKKYINTCEYCQTNKTNGHVFASRPMEKVFIISQMAQNRSVGGFTWILGIICEFSGFGRFYTLKTKSVSSVMSRIEKFLHHEGTGVYFIKTDFGSDFVDAIRNQMSEFGIKLEPTTSYHKNCQLKSFNVLKYILDAVMFEDGTSWVNSLPKANILYNAIPNKHSGLSSHEMVFGHSCRLGTLLANQKSEEDIRNMIEQILTNWGKIQPEITTKI